MLRSFKIPLVWGCLCFLLLYRTFPYDVIYAWLSYYDYKSDYSQVIAQWSLQLTPPLIPMITFAFLHKTEVKNKAIVMLSPFLLWVVGKFILAVVIYYISVKAGNIDMASERLPAIIKRIYNTEWLLVSITYGITIIVCSYAFWRERNLECS